MIDSKIRKKLLSLNFTPSDIEYICPCDASSGYKTLIKWLIVFDSVGDEITPPSCEDIDLHIQQIEYLIKTITENKIKIKFTDFCFSISAFSTKEPLLPYLLETTSIAYALILEWSTCRITTNINQVFGNLDHYLHKDLCRFLLENPTNKQCRNLAGILVEFASTETFRIIYEARELHLDQCLYWAAVTENLPIVQLLLRDPRLELKDQVDMLPDLILGSYNDSFKLIYEACESILTEVDISEIINEILEVTEFNPNDSEVEAINLIKKHINYSEALILKNNTV